MNCINCGPEEVPKIEMSQKSAPRRTHNVYSSGNTQTPNRKQTATKSSRKNVQSVNSAGGRTMPRGGRLRNLLPPLLPLPPAPVHQKPGTAPSLPPLAAASPQRPVAAAPSPTLLPPSPPPSPPSWRRRNLRALEPRASLAAAAKPTTEHHPQPCRTGLRPPAAAHAWPPYTTRADCPLAAYSVVRNRPC